jgi:hypothetical protein
MQTDRAAFAWRITVLAFAVFIALCMGIMYTGQWFVFQSRRPLDTRLIVSRGTVGLVAPNTQDPIAITDRRSTLSDGTRVQTDATSQATLLFIDQRTGETIASMVIFRDSRFTIQSKSGPRFGITNGDYLISLEDLNGRFEITSNHSDVQQAFRMTLNSSEVQVSLLRHGQYLLNFSAQETKLTTRSGLATVIDNETGEDQTIKSNERGLVRPGASIDLFDAEYSLVLNSGFERDYESDWLFYNDRLPPGTISNVVFDGQTAAVIDRSQERFTQPVQDHGETGLVQPLDLDVSSFGYLEFRATFYVEEQSLSTCGIQASECPMMVRFLYLDQEGVENVFIHGFYAFTDPGVQYPLACASCRIEHARINGQSWYTYESGNIMALWPEEQLPVKILQVSFYASGWAYKVYVSEIDLLAAESP